MSFIGVIDRAHGYPVGVCNENARLHFLVRHAYPRWWVERCRSIASPNLALMTLKIEKVTAERITVIRLIGSLRHEHLDTLTKQIQSCVGEITLDLGELELVSLEGVRFLIACQDQGVGISNASPFVTNWMKQERMPADDDLC